eukprot:TRINITY_DN12745_c0_g1_i1.p1 TRINITY_DN12745_c0_g1~~TRINITY_DN12745_c0_g1_i1.p1  ORF type:complete len:132 (+),score=31.72 TRINITY_DN12745_c0_g1_i1:30-425(+)
MALFDDADGEVAGALREVGVADHVDSKLSEISNFRGVKGIIILNDEGHPIRWYFEEAYRSIAFSYISVVNQLLKKVAAALSQLNKVEPASWGEHVTNDITCLRIRSKKNELMITPGAEYTLVIVQDLHVID